MYQKEGVMKGICIYYERKNDHCTRFEARCKGADNCFCFVDSDLQERGNRMKDNVVTVAQLTVENSALKARIAELEEENAQLRDRHIEVFVQGLEEHIKELEAEVERMNRDMICNYEYKGGR